MKIKCLGLTVCIIFLMTCISGCAPSEEDLKIAKIEKFQSKASDTFSDPKSTIFRNTKLLLSGNLFCGEVNSKNQYGGYIGFKRFAIKSDGDIIIINNIPNADIKNISNKTKAERVEYVQKYVTQFMMSGIPTVMNLAAEISLEFDKIEKFNINPFSLWVECFTEK